MTFLTFLVPYLCKCPLASHNIQDPKNLIYNYYQSNLIQRMPGSDMTSESFKESHGKIVNGRSYTYKELEESSWLETIKNVGCTVILIGLFIFCILSIYEVDIKKGSHEDVLSKIEKISNYTMSDIVNSTVQATNQLGSFVQESLKVGQTKRLELNEWVSNKSSQLLNEITTKVQKKQEVLDHILNVPRRIFNAIIEFYNHHIKGESVEEEVVEIEAEIEELEKEEIIQIDQIVIPVVETVIENSEKTEK